MAYGPDKQKIAYEERQRVLKKELESIFEDVSIVAKYAEIALDKEILKGGYTVSGNMIADEWLKHGLFGFFGIGNWDERYRRVNSVIEKANKELTELLSAKYIASGWKRVYASISTQNNGTTNSSVTVMR